MVWDSPPPMAEQLKDLLAENDRLATTLAATIEAKQHTTENLERLEQTVIRALDLLEGNLLALEGARGVGLDQTYPAAANSAQQVLEHATSTTRALLQELRPRLRIQTKWDVDEEQNAFRETDHGPA